MFTCVICEDEEVQRDRINKYVRMLLGEIHIAYEILEFESGEQLLNIYPSRVDIIFSDVKSHA